jgi:hypothetical protein
MKYPLETRVCEASDARVSWHISAWIGTTVEWSLWGLDCLVDACRVPMTYEAMMLKAPNHLLTVYPYADNTTRFVKPIPTTVNKRMLYSTRYTL